MINALRAAHDFKLAQARAKAIVYGWSQGGGATIDAAGQINAIMRRKCIHELSASFGCSYGASYKPLLKASPTNAMSWVKTIQKQSPGLQSMAAVVIYWGNQDDVVPPVLHG